MPLVRNDEAPSGAADPVRSGAIFALVPSSGHHHASDRSLPRANAPGAFGRGFANPDGLAARGDTAEYTSYETRGDGWVSRTHRSVVETVRERIHHDVVEMIAPGDIGGRSIGANGGGANWLNGELARAVHDKFEDMVRASPAPTRAERDAFDGLVKSLPMPGSSNGLVKSNARTPGPNALLLGDARDDGGRTRSPNGGGGRELFANLTSPPPSFRSPDVGDGGRRDRGRADGGVEPSNAGISLDDLILRRRSVGEGGTNVGIFSPPPSPPRGSGSRKKRGRPIKLKTSPTTRSSDDDEEEMDPQSERGARGSGDDGGDNFKRGRANKSNPLAKLAETASKRAGNHKMTKLKTNADAKYLLAPRRTTPIESDSDDDGNKVVHVRAGVKTAPSKKTGAKKGSREAAALLAAASRIQQRAVVVSPMARKTWYRESAEEVEGDAGGGGRGGLGGTSTGRRERRAPRAFWMNEGVPDRVVGSFKPALDPFNTRPMSPNVRGRSRTQIRASKSGGGVRTHASPGKKKSARKSEKRRARSSRDSDSGSDSDSDSDSDSGSSDSDSDDAPLASRGKKRGRPKKKIPGAGRPKKQPLAAKKKNAFGASNIKVHDSSTTDRTLDDAVLSGDTDDDATATTGVRSTSESEPPEQLSPATTADARKRSSIARKVARTSTQELSKSPNATHVAAPNAKRREAQKDAAALITAAIISAAPALPAPATLPTAGSSRKAKATKSTDIVINQAVGVDVGVDVPGTGAAETKRECSVDDAGNDTALQLSPPRPPEGTKNETSGPADTTATATTADTLATGSSASKSKRGGKRPGAGRPRKIRPEDGADGAGKIPAGPPRRRGRPPKNPNPDGSAGKPPKSGIMKRRGRPPKYVPITLAAFADCGAREVECDGAERPTLSKRLAAAVAGVGSGSLSPLRVPKEETPRTKERKRKSLEMMEAAAAPVASGRKKRVLGKRKESVDAATAAAAAKMTTTETHADARRTDSPQNRLTPMPSPRKRHKLSEPAVEVTGRTPPKERQAKREKRRENKPDDDDSVGGGDDFDDDAFAAFNFHADGTPKTTPVKAVPLGLRGTPSGAAVAGLAAAGLTSSPL